MTKAHHIEYRVYYEDTDASKIMYHGSFIRFCERGRTEFLRALGLSCAALDSERDIRFVVRHMDVDYLKSAYLEDVLRVETSIKSLKNSSFVMKQSIFCQDSMLFSALVTLVTINPQGKPIRVPEDLRDLFQDYVLED